MPTWEEEHLIYHLPYLFIPDEYELIDDENHIKRGGNYSGQLSKSFVYDHGFWCPLCFYGKNKTYTWVELATRLCGKHGIIQNAPNFNKAIDKIKRML